MLYNQIYKCRVSRKEFEKQLCADWIDFFLRLLLLLFYAFIDCCVIYDVLLLLHYPTAHRKSLIFWLRRV